jgi:hypothetical protein
MSVWERIGRWVDSVFGGERSDEVEPTKVEAAIRLIQSTIEDEQRSLQVRRLRVSELSAETRARLALPQPG